MDNEYIEILDAIDGVVCDIDIDELIEIIENLKIRGFKCISLNVDIDFETKPTTAKAQLFAEK